MMGPQRLNMTETSSGVVPDANPVTSTTLPAVWVDEEAPLIERDGGAMEENARAARGCIAGLGCCCWEEEMRADNELWESKRS